MGWSAYWPGPADAFDARFWAKFAAAASDVVAAMGLDTLLLFKMLLGSCTLGFHSCCWFLMVLWLLLTMLLVW
jgi:hypothetical protein